MKKNYRQKLGDWGEGIAAYYFQKNKYEIIKKNYRCREGELDLICRKKDWLYFVEVKTRTSLAFGPGEESVSEKKIEKIQTAIYKYLAENKLDQAKWQLIIFSLLLDKKNKKYSARIIRPL